MFGRAWKWVKDNKWKTLAGVAVVGGYVLYSRSQGADHSKEFQKQKMTSYWRDSQIAADRTIHRFLDLLRSRTEDHTHLSEILIGLRNPELSSQDKARIFKELRTAVFSSYLIYMYSVVLLSTYMRISVNVVGRHLYSMSANAEAPSLIDMMRAMLPNTGLFSILNGGSEIPERKLEDDTILNLTSLVRDKSLGSTQHFIDHGFPILAEIVSQACIGTLENHPLDRALCLDELLDIFVHIRHVVEAQFLRPFEGRIGNLLEVLLMPPEDTTAYPFATPAEAIFSTGLQPEDMLRLLSNEKRNVIESAGFQSLFQHSTNTAFVALSEIVGNAFPRLPKPIVESAPLEDSNSSTNSSKSEGPQDPVTAIPVISPSPAVSPQPASRPPPPSFPLAKLLPGLTNHFKVLTDVNENLTEERVTATTEINEFSYRVFWGPKNP